MFKLLAAQNGAGLSKVNLTVRSRDAEPWHFWSAPAPAPAPGKQSGSGSGSGSK